MNNEKTDWVITDPDSCQLRRQLLSGNSYQFELIQIDSYEIHDGSFPSFFRVAHGEIDFDDISDKEILDALTSYGYDSFEALLDVLKTYEDSRECITEAYGQIAEMLFEIQSEDYYIPFSFSSFNDAAAKIEQITNKDLSAFKDIQSSLDSKIECAQSMKCCSIKNSQHNNVSTKDREVTLK